MPASQDKAQSGYCFLEEVSQSSKIPVLPMSVINFFDFSLNVLVSSVLFKSCKKNFVRVILELLNQLFDCFSAIGVLLLVCRIRYAWDCSVNVAAAVFSVTSRHALVVILVPSFQNSFAVTIFVAAGFPQHIKYFSVRALPHRWSMFGTVGRIHVDNVAGN